MAFTPLNSTEIAAGKPVKQELWTKTKDDFDDHEARITAVENAVNTNQPLTFSLNGKYWRYATPQTGVIFYRVVSEINILAARLQIFDAGTSGTTEIDVLYKDGANPFTSIFSTLPAVAFGAGDYAVSTNQILIASPVNIPAGSILRIDVTATQYLGDSAQIQIEYEVA